ncbi:MAG: Mur ligase family protein [Bradyrhizobium sp.]|uniref:UDP-N-acetylmuramate--L-alanine ligase n=1 Tax=Bradyrhizobium sp. TaxID=376 RepID=UPI002730388B|nr:Mur ligase family protein [Bradyrhizobium sp.]MDP1867157.1 Mur ligase family protein [Bradyrhizobium sp.]
MNFSKAHFIGIAGKGMSATALLLRQMGVRITGSDEGFYPPVSDYLKNEKIPFAEGYRKENIPEDADVIVIGKNAKLTPGSNEEVRAAMDSGKPVRSFADLLHDMTADSETIVAAGSYGKSTCTALLAWCLRVANKDPSYFIGEITNGFDTHAHRGQGRTFILEGDEYPASNWDSRSKFLLYNARNVLLTSATHDHVNVFPTHADYLAPFRTLLGSLPADGLLVVNGGETHARTLAAGLACPIVFYGVDDRTHWHAENIDRGAETGFDLVRGNERIARLSTRMLGDHNIENIVGVSAMLLEKKLVSPEQLKAGMSTFQGVKRRMELLSPSSSVPVYEGFGSSYEKARSAIVATKLHFPDRRLIVVFEPHTFTWRNRSAIAAYDDVFAGASRIFIFEPASQGAASHAQLSQGEIVARTRAANYDAEAITDPENALQRLSDVLRADDVVLLLTSGELGGLIRKIPQLVETKYPAADRSLFRLNSDSSTTGMPWKS